MDRVWDLFGPQSFYLLEGFTELRSGEIIAVTVPLLMRGGGNPSKAAYASLEVLVSSVAALAVIQGLPWTKFFPAISCKGNE